MSSLCSCLNGSCWQGISRTSRDVLLESAWWTTADIDPVAVEGEVLGAVAVARDVTERVERERAAGRSS
jgi:hypothetical protein